MDSREDFDTQPKVPIDASTDSREDFDVHVANHFHLKLEFSRRRRELGRDFFAVRLE
jgi:hypothetical protein